MVIQLIEEIKYMNNRKTARLKIKRAVFMISKTFDNKKVNSCFYFLKLICVSKKIYVLHLRKFFQNQRFKNFFFKLTLTS